MEYQSISDLANTTVNTIISTLAAQQVKITNAHAALNTSLTKLNNTLSDPPLTKPALEALNIECLAHLDKYAALRAGYKGALDQIDLEALEHVFFSTPEGKAGGKEAVKAWLEEGLEYYTKWYRETEEEEEEVDVEKTRREIERLVKVCLALLEEAKW